jgi:ribosome-associated translation inhibitor RaiA
MQFQLICEDFKVTDSIKTCVADNIGHMNTMKDSGHILHVFIREPRRKLFQVLFEMNFHGKTIVAKKEGVDLYKLIGETRKTFERSFHAENQRFLDRKHGKGA